MREETSFEPLATLLKDAERMGDGVARDAEILAFWPRRFSRLWKVRLRTARGDVTAYVKQYRPIGDGDEDRERLRERVVKDFEVTHELEQEFGPVPHLSVPRPIACFPDRLTVVFEESSGESLFESIERGATAWSSRSAFDDLLVQCHRSGEWLRRLQESHRIDASYSVEALRDYVETRLRQLISEPRSGFTEGAVEAVREYYARLEERGEDLDLRMSWAHADFCPGNVIADASRLTVLDLAMYETGSIYQDVSHFCHHLELFLLKPIYRPRAIRRLVEAFLDGYSPEGGVDQTLLHAFRIRHLITHCVGVLKIDGAPLHERWYNRHVIRHHRQRIVREAAELVT